MFSLTLSEEVASLRQSLTACAEGNRAYEREHDRLLAKCVASKTEVERLRGALVRIQAEIAQRGALPGRKRVDWDVMAGIVEDALAQ